MSKKSSDYKRYIDFLQRASHDLRAPTRQIKFFYSQLSEKLNLSENYETSEVDGYIKTAIDQAVNQFDRILTLSKVHTREYDKHLVNLNQMLQSVNHDLAQQYDVQLNGIKDSKQEYVILIEEQLLTLMLNEIIDNIEKYALKDSLDIDVRLAFDVNTIYMTIQDNGPGIQQSLISEASLPFRRFHSQNEVPGVGLGLTIAQQCAERMGGTLSLQNDHGLAVKISLPNVAR